MASTTAQILIVIKANNEAITFSTYVNISDGLTILAWLSGKAACSLDGHRVLELQRVYDQE